MTTPAALRRAPLARGGLDAATRRQRLLAIAAIAGAASFCAAATPVAEAALPASTALFGIAMGVAILATGVSTVLLAAQAVAATSYAQAVLAIAYGLTALTLAPFTALYPGVIGGLTARVHAGGQSIVLLFSLWHLTIVAGVVAYHVVERRFPTGAPSRGGRAVTVAAGVAAATLWPAAVAGALWGHGIPLLVVDGRFTPLYSQVVLPGEIAAFAVATLMPLGNRGFAPLLDLWLSVACVGSMFELAILDAGGRLFSVGWYASRVDELVTVTALLAALLWQSARMYSRLALDSRRLADEANRDGLTSLPNRRAFDRELAAAIERARSQRRAFALAMVDVDRFKHFNDVSGHLAGDGCLRRVAAALEESVRMGDLVARYGGEEFGILFETAEHDALVVGERACGAVRGAGLAAADGAPVTISVGIATYAPGDDAARLVERADAALYRAKETGRDRVEIATSAVR